jgi:hypothetical protein
MTADPRPRPPAIAHAVDTPYEGWDVLDQWDSASFNDLTRQVLRQRLEHPPGRRFFTPAQFVVLEAACARLLATEPGVPPIANFIDDDLAQGRGEGFRHPDHPRADIAWRHGIDGLDATARRLRGAGFDSLDGARQDDVLRAVQAGDVAAEDFGPVDPQHFFVHLLLKSAAGHFYGRPEGWNEIGFGGPAGPRGYVRLDLDRRDPWEAPLAPRGVAER